ncbi:MAG: type II toxin-antitoxin system tRNA(fMet)-specific endonuclease VapC [Terriglobia bacterium]
MTYLLDTNTCIRYLNGRSPEVRRRLEPVAPEDVALCSVVKAELYYGAARTRDPGRTLAHMTSFMSPFSSLPFDDFCAVAYGRIRAQLEQAGTPIGPNDMMIAAIAVAADLTLVTHNTREFARVAGLILTDWET